MDNVKTVLGVLGGLFFLYLMFGGLLEPESSREEYTRTIDCSDEQMAKYNKYCNGSYRYESTFPDNYETGAYRGW